MGLDAELPLYLLNVGTAYHSQGKLGLAREYYARGMRIAQETTRPTTRLLLLSNSAAIDVLLGRFDEASALLERALAARAGLGWIGRNTMLLDEASGPWSLLGEIVTTLEIPPDAPGVDRCGTCTACVDACPTDALLPGRRLDAGRCLSYWTIEHRGALPDAWAAALGHRAFGCDDCLAACPFPTGAAPRDPAPSDAGPRAASPTASPCRAEPGADVPAPPFVPRPDLATITPPGQLTDLALFGGFELLGQAEGDDRERYVCGNCGMIHYSNPRVIVGCVPVYQGKVLLCLRAIEPRKNYWTLPAGFMENGETTLQGAARETWEEARAKVSNLDLYRVFDVPHISQVYMFYRCDVDDGEFGVGPESLESDLYAEADIPWDRIAFPVVTETLKAYFADAPTGEFPVQVSAIDLSSLRRRS